MGDRHFAERSAGIRDHGVIALVAAQFAFAQSWPAKPIRVIVPLTAGSATDVIPRITFEQVSALDRPADDRREPGRRGRVEIGAGTVAKAEPDGYTILVAFECAHRVTGGAAQSPL